MATTWIINIGSSSKKYALYEEAVQVFAVHAEREGAGFGVTMLHDGKQTHGPLTGEDYDDAFRFVLAQARRIGIVAAEAATAIGVRVVAPGTYFQAHHPIDTTYKNQLLRAATIAPLHIEHLMRELDLAQAALPSLPLYGISDSAFHATLPPRARLYALPLGDAQELDIYRFGYHGLSVGSLVELLHRHEQLPRRLIVCHLGSGASITALLGGKSIDTSMGFTPDEGLPMATRVGTIDAGAVLYLAQHLGGAIPTIDYCNHKSGLLGVSNTSGDIRELLKLEAAGDQLARTALDLYVYQIQKHIGAYVAALRGVDMILFTGTVGERSAPIRERVCAGLDYLGAALDVSKNANCYGQDALLHAPRSRVPLAVLCSREMDELARITSSLHR